MKETTGVLIALLSSALGGGAAVATRFLIADFDPITLAMVRFGGGALLLIPVALLLRPKLPPRRDWPAAALLGFLFYGVFSVVYAVALSYTTAARGTLALSTLPLMTMVVGAVLGLEKLSARKTLGVLVAMGGVAIALSASLAAAPDGAWRGDLIMAVGTVFMALYNVYSRPYTQRSSPLGFLTFSMLAGGGALIATEFATGRAALILQFDTAQALVGLYLAAGGGAFGFFLWVVALKYASPTRVANTITINPLIAMAFGALLLGEPVTSPLILGLAAVCAGVFIATTNSRPAARS
jgi:drug/metabolite transporter (DMT)-like permease